MREAGVHADMKGDDWADWSMGRAVIRRTLKKIHIRLWHATTAIMNELPLTDGVKQEVLNPIKITIDTCSTCRA